MNCEKLKKALQEDQQSQGAHPQETESFEIPLNPGTPAPEPEKEVPAPQPVPDGALAEMSGQLKALTQAVSALEQRLADREPAPEPLQPLMEKLDRSDRQLAQCLRENASFQVQVRQGMQHDLDVLQKQVSGEQFTPLLKEIAQVYSEYQFLLEEESLSGKARSSLQSLFDTLEDLLLDYDAEVQRTGIGQVRPARTCRIAEKHPTGDESLHNTIAACHKPGVVRGRLVLAPEVVDVYVYDESLKPAAPAPEDTPAEEPAPAAEDAPAGEPAPTAEEAPAGEPAPAAQAAPV